MGRSIVAKIPGCRTVFTDRVPAGYDLLVQTVADQHDSEDGLPDDQPISRRCISVRFPRNVVLQGITERKAAGKDENYPIPGPSHLVALASHRIRIGDAGSGKP